MRNKSIVELVPANQYSIDELTDAYNQTRIDYVVPMPMSARRLQEYIDVYDVDLARSVVAVEEGEMAGLCMLGVRDWRSWITRLGVLPTERRLGAGRAMMEYSIEQSKQAGITSIFLEVITGNAPAHKLFTRLGFIEVRKLLILRRPPGPPTDDGITHQHTATWISEDRILERAAEVEQLPAWTNQVESLKNAGNVRGIELIDHDDELSGWLSYEKTMLQLKRVMVGASNGSGHPPAAALLHTLHSQFPTLDTIAENIPGDAPYLDAFFDNQYVEAFSRIEMRLDLKIA